MKIMEAKNLAKTGKEINLLKIFDGENDGPAIVLATIITVVLFITAISYMKNSSSPVTRYLDRAQKEMEEENYKVAEEYFRKILEVDENNTGAIKGLIIINKINKNYFQAKKEMDKLLALGEGNSDDYFELGKIFFQEIDYKNAIDCFEKAIKIKPGKLDFRNYLLRCYIETEDYSSAIGEGKEILKISEGDIETHINIATAYYKLSDYKTALKWYEEALKLDPENATAIYGRKYCLQELPEDYGETPESADKLIDKGNKLYLEGNYADAAVYYNNALYLDPSSTRALYNLGNCHYAQGNYEEALNCYNKVLSIDPNHLQAQKARENVLLYIN